MQRSREHVLQIPPPWTGNFALHSSHVKGAVCIALTGGGDGVCD
jgi:hypothetical protein